MRSGYRWLLLALVWLVGVNLRTALIGVAPVLALLRRQWGLSYAGTGLLFSLPLALMGAASLAGGWLSDRWGPRRTILLSLGMVAAGAGLRATAHTYAALLAWTAVLGTGIGTAQPTLQKVVKQWFADRAGLATGVATSGLMAGSLIGVGLAPGLVAAGGWRGSFLFWGAVAAAAWLLWLALARGGAGASTRSRQAPARLHVDRTLALAGALFFLQGVCFYTSDAWLPLLYQAHGWNLAASSQPLASFQSTMLVTGLGAPAISDRMRRRRPLLLASSAVFAAACTTVLLWPLAAPLVAGALLGAAYGAFFSLTMVLPVDIAGPERVGTAAGFVFTLGYVGALFGPVVSGALRDATGSAAAGGLPVLAASLLFFLTSMLLRETGGAPAAPERTPTA